MSTGKSLRSEAACFRLLKEPLSYDIEPKNPLPVVPGPDENVWLHYSRAGRVLVTNSKCSGFVLLR